ncbi:MAG: prepilin peptidase [Bryobacteraceae bacterium]
MSFPPVVLQAVLAALVVTAAVFDVRSRRIPNWLNLFGVVAGLLLNSFLDVDKYNWRSALMGLGLAFAVYFPLYLLRGMGAGDVKLMAAVGALVGPANWFAIFVLSNVLGAAVAIVLLLSKGKLWGTLRNVGYMLNELTHFRPPYIRREELDLSSPKSLKMPHGLAIAMGSLSFLVAVWIWAPRA